MTDRGLKNIFDRRNTSLFFCKCILSFFLHLRTDVGCMSICKYSEMAFTKIVCGRESCQCVHTRECMLSFRNSLLEAWNTICWRRKHQPAWNHDTKFLLQNSEVLLQWSLETVSTQRFYTFDGSEVEKGESGEVG